MLKDLESRTVLVGNEEITVYRNKNKNWHSAFYQNNDTKTIDNQFKLTGEPLRAELEHKYHEIIDSLDDCTDFEIKNVLKYFISIAKQKGNFVGLPEKEIQDHIEREELIYFNYSDIRKALKSGYLKRIKVEEVNVLFPANIKNPFVEEVTTV